MMRDHSQRFLGVSAQSLSPYQHPLSNSFYSDNTCIASGKLKHPHLVYSSL